MEYDDIKALLIELGADNVTALEALAQQTIKEDRNLLFNSLIKGNKNVNWKEIKEKLEQRPSRRLMVNFDHEGFKYTLILQNRPIIDEEQVTRETVSDNMQEQKKAS